MPTLRMQSDNSALKSAPEIMRPSGPSLSLVSNATVDEVTPNPDGSSTTKKIDACENLDAARQVFDQALAHGVQPSEALYTALARKSGSIGFVFFILREMETHNIAAGDGFFRVSLDKARSAIEICRILEEMQRHGAEIRAAFAADLIAHASDFAAAITVFDAALRVGIADLTPAFAALQGKVRQYPDAVRLAAEMRSAGVQVTKGLLLQTADLAVDFAAASEAISALKAADVAITTDQAEKWMTLSRYFDEASHVINRLEALKLVPTVGMMQTWLDRAMTPAQKCHVLDYFEDTAAANASDLPLHPNDGLRIAAHS